MRNRTFKTPGLAEENHVFFMKIGRCNCPYFAKAELVADQLVRNLPNFSVCKISKNANEWEVSICVVGWKVLL